MKRGWSIAIISVVVLVIVFSLVKSLFSLVKIGGKGFVTGTEDINVDSRFSFTISPNNNYLVYVNQDENTVLLNLDDNEKKILTDNSQKEEFFMNKFRLSSESCWSQDSQYCVSASYWLRDPLEENTLNPQQNYPSQLIDLSDSSNPELIEDPPQKYSEIESQEFTCSDCYSFEKEIEILEQNLDEDYYGFEGPLVEYKEIVISREGDKIYYLENNDERKVKLYEKDINSGIKKRVTTFNRPLKFCEQINRMRLSPNQEFLAFQRSSGCGWSSSPKLYILDLKSGMKFKVDKRVFYNVHWSSDSSKLYYYSQGIRDGLRYVKIR